MAYEQKDFSGSLFKNDRKQQPNHPDYKGSALIDGREYWMSAWIKNADNPDKKTFMSFSFEAKEDGGAVMDRGQQGRDTGGAGGSNLDDDLPF
jgi:hypothetical protein